MTTINISSLSAGDINKAIRELEAYRDSLESKTDELCRVLAEEGAMVAQDSYGSSVAVDVVPSEHGSKINANGDAVVFMEFGAGDATSASELAENLPFEVSKGSYSRENAKQYSRWGYWWFGGHVMTEVVPRRGLLNATRHIEDVYERRAREVFGSD